MNSQVFSPLFGGITNTPPNLESPQLYSSWSTCADDTNAVASLQDCPQKRAQINLPHFSSGPNMFGLAPNILEEPNKQEPVTDWNALSRSFPPMWSSNSENSFSGLFPKNILENKDLPNLVGTLHPDEENLRESSSIESLKKDFDGFHFTGSWKQFPNRYTEKMYRDATPTNNVFNQQDALENQNIPSYDEKQLHSDGGRSHIDFSTFSTLARVEGSTKKEYPEIGRGVLGEGDPEGPSQYFSQLSNNSTADGIWDQVTQEHNLSPERYTDFTTSHKSQQFSFYTPASNEENSSLDGTTTKLQETYLPNMHNTMNIEATLGNTECNIPVYPPKLSCNPWPLKPALQNTDSSYNGYKWLDTEILNTVTGSCVTHGKQMSSQLSSAYSSRPSADQPAVQPAFSQMSPMSPSIRDGQLQVSNNIPNSSGFSSSSEKQKEPSLVAHSQNDSLVTSGGLYGKIPISTPSSGLSLQYSANQGFYSNQSPFNANESMTHNERRGENNGIPHPGYAGPNQAQFDALRGKQDQNGGRMTEFINPPFLPLFPLVSGYKHPPGFPPFNPSPFPSPPSVAFPPVPFPGPELVNLSHYDDFPHLSTFINNNVCAGVPAPYFTFPPLLGNYWPYRFRSGPANELHICLEECYDQWRALEMERKKAEAELVRNFPGRRISSFQYTPFFKLPARPSRVDRLIVDQFREQARVHALIGKMARISAAPVHTSIVVTLGQHLEAIHATQARREDEIVNAANPQRQGAFRYNNENDVLALAAAIKNLSLCTQKTRTALLCALHLTLPKTSANNSAMEEEVERALRELCLPASHL